jgi:methylmalonyl-CoA mutase
MREWLETGGLEPVYDGERATPGEAVERMRASGAPLVCLCGTDDAYAGQAEAFAQAIKASGVKGVALAGRPGEFEQAWRAAGVDEFIFAGGDAVATLESLYRRIGVELRSTGNTPS